MIRKLFDLIIDVLLFLGDFVCHMPSRIADGFEVVAEWLHYVFIILPYKISLIYRFRKMWYPAKSDFKTYDLTNEMKEWLDTDLGKYRWKIVSRLVKDNDGYSSDAQKKFYLCFRYKTDAMAFKLRWTE